MAEISLEEALKRIDDLEAQNAALRGAGKINREVKNSVFLDLFGRKEYILKLFHSIHMDVEDITEDDITVVTIENVLTIKPYNDFGVLLNRKKRKLLIMAEAQSQWSINVIFRIWEYVIDTLMNYFINNGYDLYSTPKLPMPDVETYIIYTGKSIPKILSSGELETDEYGQQILSLNREFFNSEKGKPELTAKVLNFRNSSGIIEEYIRFSQVFDEQRLIYKEDPENALKEIFRICREEGILNDYLAEHRAEVEKIMMTIVSPEYLEKAANRTKEIHGAIMYARDMGQDNEAIKDYLIRKFGLDPEYAQNCVDAEWDEDSVIT